MAVTLSLAAAEALAARALRAHRVSPANADSVARALVAAEADGIASHGLARVPAYADQAQAGKVDGLAEPVLRRTAPAALHVDAGHGFAFPAIDCGLEAASETVGETGILALGIGRSHHFGVAGHHVERSAERGMVALGFSNTPAAIAPWGGKRAMFGTNPIAFAWPRPAGPPLVIDLSVSTVARGKLVLAAGAGQPIPADWALDAEGRPTMDARAGLAGSMAPLGGAGAGAKGAALALMGELLCGALTGSRFGHEASSFFDAEGPPPSVGHLLLLLDPARLGGDAAAARGEALFAAMLAEDGTRLPGDRRLQRREQAHRSGITVPDGLHQELRRRADRVQ